MERGTLQVQRWLLSTWTLILGLVLSPSPGLSQVNSGSNGSDGALNPTSNLVIDMHDHPDGIYQYTSVNIPSGMTVSFIPNAANTPVVWLVQGSCTISGTISVAGQRPSGVAGGTAGPGGYAGGNGNLPGGVPPGSGSGPGGGKVRITPTPGSEAPSNASYATAGEQRADFGQWPPGDVYGHSSLLPLLGGSGGSGSFWDAKGGGGGGGGAILIACSGTINIAGSINAVGGTGFDTQCCPTVLQAGGGGSGGAVRLVATSLVGTGNINTLGGTGYAGYCGCCPCYAGSQAGKGRIRLEAFSDLYSGATSGEVAHGIQGIILLASNQEPRIGVASVAGIPAAINPTGQLTTPDVVIPATQSNPVMVVISCQNIPLHSDITVDVKPANGAGVSATGQNASGTVESSTASIPINMPSGGGTIQARATVDLGLASAKESRRKGKRPSPYETGLAMNGERFRQIKLKTTLGGQQESMYVTESGRTFSLSTAASRRAVKAVSTRPSAQGNG